jgi:outer membrane protein assembly factor BamA
MILIVLAYSGISAAAEGDQGLDTTRVRQPEKPKKSAGQVFADIPGEILKLPVRTVRFVSYSAVNPPISYVTGLVKFSGPVRKYVPILGYSSNAGLKLGFGLRKITKDFWDDVLDFKWYYSTNDYQSYQFRFRLQKFLGERLGIDLFYRYKKRPRESFYGVGMTTNEQDEANYTLESSDFRLDLPFHAGEKLAVGLTGGFLITNLYDGEDTDSPRHLDTLYAASTYALLPGRLDGSRYVRLGLILDYDSRNSGGQPSKGIHVLTRTVRYIGTNRSEDLGYLETKVDFRHYLNVWKNRILATRLFVQRFDADNSNKLATPANLISRLGGASGLRGYSGGRFIDNDLALASVEWRFPVWKILDGFAFLDEGRVYEEITDSKVFKGWKYSAGFGLRVWNVQEVSFSSTVAFSDEGSKIYVAGGITW